MRENGKNSPVMLKSILFYKPVKYRLIASCAIKMEIRKMYFLLAAHLTRAFLHCSLRNTLRGLKGFREK